MNHGQYDDVIGNIQHDNATTRLYGAIHITMPVSMYVCVWVIGIRKTSN